MEEILMHALALAACEATRGQPVENGVALMDRWIAEGMARSAPPRHSYSEIVALEVQLCGH